MNLKAIWMTTFTLGLAGLALTISPGASRGAGPLTPVGNVTWTFNDYISGCPSGDSVRAGHPSKLRIAIHYRDATGHSRVDVPPESIWVMVSTDSANVVANDLGQRTFADGPTTGDPEDEFGGFTRIQLHSLSGKGTLRVDLYVSGVYQGTKRVHIRTTDPDASGRDSAGTDQTSPGDIDWSGGLSAPDYSSAIGHLNHWHRHVVHGALVPRSAFCETCQDGSSNTMGDGKPSWSPSGRYLAYEVDDPTTGCKINLVSSDPGSAVSLTPFTFPTSPDSADYDPSWSPLGTDIIFARKDHVIYRKPVPWLGGAESAVTGSAFTAITYPAISPDGGTIAFTRTDAGGFHIYTVPVLGGPIRQLTTEEGVVDRYPEWSPDGTTIVFERREAGQSIGLFGIRPGDPLPTSFPFLDVAALHPTLPAYSPDGKVFLCGIGATQEEQLASTREVALAASDTLVYRGNYPSFTYFVPFPRYSADGTRACLAALNPADPLAVSPQVWVTRLNMNRPPRIRQVGSQALADTTPRVFINAVQNLPTSIVVSVVDPEADPGGIAYWASYLQNGMSLQDSTLTWTPTAPVGTTFTVKLGVSTFSGGSDAILAILTVTSGLQPGVAARPAVAFEQLLPSARGHNAVALRAPLCSNTPKLCIFDVSGRRVAESRGIPGGLLIWSGRDRNGSRVAPGVYLYRATAGEVSTSGKVVIAAQGR